MPEMIERRAQNPNNSPPFTWGDMDKHMDDKLAPIHAKLDTLLDTVKKMVPDGDFDSHRRYHESKMKAAEEAELAWKKRKEEVITWIFKGVLITIGTVFFAGVVSYFNVFTQRAVATVDVPKAPAPAALQTETKK